MLQKIIVYIPFPLKIIFSTPNTSLNDNIKYENGEHWIIFNNVWWFANLDKSHIIGVNQKNNCITIPNKFAKSGKTVVTADVNLVTEIIKHNDAKTTYTNVKIFGKNPNTAHIPIAIISRKTPTKLEEIIDIAGITSTGKTIFLTR